MKKELEKFDPSFQIASLNNLKNNIISQLIQFLTSILSYLLEYTKRN